MFIASEERQQSLDDLEIRVYAVGDVYVGEIRTRDGNSASCEMAPFPFETSDLATVDPRSYGIELFRCLFREQVGDVFRQARWGTESYTRSTGPVAGLRLRLWLDPEAESLQHLRWEALHDPERDIPLSVELAFSRFLRSSSPYGWPVRERPLRVLLAASSLQEPPALSVGGINSLLNRVASPRAVQQIRTLLELDHLFDDPSADDLRERLQKGFHILHLWAHTTEENGQGSLLLKSSGGTGVQKVPFHQLPAALQLDAQSAPHLVFLVTDSQDEGSIERTLSPLATVLLDAGVQAVVSVPESVEHSDLLTFSERFYDVLLRSGIIDVAMAEARTKLYFSRPDSPDSWVWTAPTLFMRIAEGQLFQALPEVLQSIVQSRVFKSFKEDL